MAVSTATRVSARERILETANRLFYAEGIQTIGVDRIIDEAGVAKASLYKTFGSKNALIAAYLDSRHQAILERMHRAMADVESPRDKVLAVFDSHAAVFRRADYHGCPFATASAESTPGDGVDEATRRFRRAVRGLFRDLAAELGADDPEALARRLQLVYDGASLSARIDRDPSIADDARAAAELLLDTAAPSA
ncbi:AcrR family transcriptional regulator [Friedmanniella endophytica]|uniref:AcrR family transcriptional regulator n=1 Tax=Microlunatus kandeliicorticis TaxID=1759536 RepID=A0A7W3IR86_9ACTN|nr:TetR/AcrR family transcriptional regulator [Microlunatus kandeliicorticis]MBA8793764.1 AcrR family transcriptional regulator [Microlunatus kandeliicorticis]